MYNYSVYYILYKYKKQLNKIEGDGRTKKYTNKICGDNHIHYTSLRLLFSIIMLLLMSTPIRGSGYFCFSVLVLSFESS